MNRRLKRFWQPIERSLFVAAFLGDGGFCLYWASPLNLIALDATVSRSAAITAEIGGGAAIYERGGYDVGFWAKRISCRFRLSSFFLRDSANAADNALSNGDRVTIVVPAREFREAGRSVGRDCRTGEPIPGVEHPDLSPHLIEPLEVWRDGWVVLHWVPHRWLLWGFAALLIFVGLMMLFAPLIDRRTDRYHKARGGMSALRAYDEAAKQRRETEK